MIDWTAALLPASFNGLVFYVEKSHVEAGHRVAKTLIPNGGHVLESFGPAARSFEMDAYFTGDFCTVQAEAMLSAAENGHMGLITLPDSGSFMVRVTKAKRAFNKDKLNFVAVEIEALAEPFPFTGGLSLGALGSAIFGLVASLAPALGQFMSSSLRLSGQPSPVIEATVMAAAGTLGDLMALRDAQRLDPVALAAVAPAFEAAEAALATLPSSPAAFAEAATLAAIALGDVAPARPLLSSIIALGRPDPPPASPVSSGVSLVIAANQTELVGLTSCLRAVALAEALPNASFADRPEAVETRALAAAVFDDAIARIGRGGLEAVGLMREVRGRSCDLIGRRAAEIAPLINVSAQRRLPALWWAWRLYADPSRSADLVTRTRSPHPARLPQGFEALAL